MASIFDTLLLGKKYNSIEFFTQNGKDSIAFLQLENKKKEITVARAEIYKEAGSLEKGKYPLWVTVNTAHVLQKQVPDTDTNDRKLLHKAFPNIKTDEFYYEIWRCGTLSFISVCRKSYVEELLLTLSGFRVAGFSLGVSPVSNIINFDLPGVIFTNTQRITPMAEENNILLLDAAVNHNYTINGLEISNPYLLCFAGALTLLIKTGSTTGNTNEQSVILMEGYRQKAFFEKGMVAGVAFILVVLLINFVLFTYYFSKAEELDQAAALYSADADALMQIRRRVEGKQEKLKAFAGTASSESAGLINELVESLPHSITLSEMSFHPMEKKIKEGERIDTQDNIITVSGTTSETSDFTHWIADSEKVGRVAKITIVSFGKGPDSGADFTIQIILNDHEAR